MCGQVPCSSHGWHGVQTRNLPISSSSTLCHVRCLSNAVKRKSKQKPHDMVDCECYCKGRYTSKSHCGFHTPSCISCPRRLWRFCHVTFDLHSSSYSHSKNTSVNINLKELKLSPFHITFGWTIKTCNLTLHGVVNTLNLYTVRLLQNIDTPLLILTYFTI